jgi:homoserine kinase type II
MMAVGAWDIGRIAAVTPYGRGMNSMTWLITAGSGRWVAKAVPLQAAAQFEAGLAAAAHLEAAGLGAGAPRATVDGRFSATVAGYRVAMLRFVAGRELDPAGPAEQRRWGETLGLAHRVLRAAEPPPGLQEWHWVEPEAPHLEIEPWIRPAVRTAVERLRATQQRVSFTYGVLHADPAPEAFLVDAQGQVAIIDWSAVTWGPLMYDVASARLYAGSETEFSEFINGYLTAMPLPPKEVEALPTFLRFRWAVQADYFARRIWNRDFTGIDGPADNAKGLADARHQLTSRS